MIRLAFTLVTLMLASGGASSPASHAARPHSGTMGVTAIAGIINKTTGAVTVKTWELSATGIGQPSTPVEVQVPAGQSVTWGHWVPWCTSQTAFINGQHYITIQIQSPAKTWYLWQSNENWQDRVRYNDQPWWKPNATPVPGVSEVDGDRVLEVNADGSFQLRRP
jgi:hypothetical protein